MNSVSAVALYKWTMLSHTPAETHTQPQSPTAEWVFPPDTTVWSDSHHLAELFCHKCHFPPLQIEAFPDVVPRVVGMAFRAAERDLWTFTLREKLIWILHTAVNSRYITRFLCKSLNMQFWKKQPTKKKRKKNRENKSTGERQRVDDEHLKPIYQDPPLLLKAI